MCVLHTGVIDALVAGIIQSPFHDTLGSPPCHSTDDVDTVIGERVLREARDLREQKVRLREIEDELARLVSRQDDKVRDCEIIFVTSAKKVMFYPAFVLSLSVSNFT